MTATILEIVEEFLTHSDQKLEELSKKNQAIILEEEQ